MPGRYVGGLIRDIARITLGVLAGIEAIYLSDKVITHLLPTTLQNQAGFADLALLVLYATPEILFIGFPVALLIALGFAAVGMAVGPALHVEAEPNKRKDVTPGAVLELMERL